MKSYETEHRHNQHDADDEYLPGMSDSDEEIGNGDGDGQIKEVLEIPYTAMGVFLSILRH
jgi:hypothetical protein